MKKRFLILTIALLIGSTAMAQEKDLTEEQRTQIETQIDTYLTNLDLPDHQKPKFEEITRRYGKQLLELKESDKGRLLKYKEFKAIRKKKDAEMKNLLSNEKYETYLETQNKIQEKMIEKKGNKL